MNSPRRLKTLFFDLDDTLYPASSGVWDQIAERINQYMLERVRIPQQTLDATRLRLFKTYGTSLRGLKAEFGVDEHDYLQYVHDVPLASYIAPEPAVRAAIQKYRIQKIVFTNADAAHAMRVMERLELQDCFDLVVDILALWPYCKPMREAFDVALAQANSPNPAECALIDDQIHNIVAAHKLGFFTVLVGRREPLPEERPFIDACIPHLAELPAAIDSFIYTE